MKVNQVSSADENGLLLFQSAPHRLEKWKDDDILSQKKDQLTEEEWKEIVDAEINESDRSEMREQLAIARFNLEDIVGKVTMERLIPSLMHSKVRYNLIIESSDSAHPGQRNENSSKQGIYSVSRLRDDWPDILVLDGKLKENRHIYVPESEHLVGSIHEFNLSKKKSADAQKIQYRTRAGGIGLLWAITDYLTGRRDISNDPGRDQLSIAGTRIVAEDRRLGQTVEKVAQILRKDRYDSKDYGSVRLHVVGRSGDEAAEKFAKTMSPNVWDPNNVDKMFTRMRKMGIEDYVETPYYVELITHAGKDPNKTLHNNSISTIIFPSSVHNALRKSQTNNHRAFKEARDGNRWESYGAFEWAVARTMAPTLLDGPSARYAERIIDLYSPRPS